MYPPGLTLGRMRIRFQLALAIFLTGSLGVAALLADRAGFTRQILYGRAEARALAISESVGRLALPNMKSAELRPLSTGVSAFADLPNVSYIRVLNDRGQTVFESARAAAAASENERIDVRTAIKDPDTGIVHGSVHLGVATTGLRESLNALAWRGAAIGLLAILALALVALTIGTLLGRKLEMLTEAVERLKKDGAPAAGFRGDSSEVDRLATAFSALHQRLLDEEEQLKKMEAFKDELTSMLVHDMKHPVAILGAALSALERGDSASEGPEARKDRLLTLAKTAVGRESAMIEDLLQLAKLKSSDMPVQRTRMPLAGFLAECAAENSLIAAQSGRPWRSDFEDLSSCWIYGDPASLRRLIGNLVLNAADHTPSGTPISLGARLTGRDRSKVEISVRDAGPGIPAERREAMFRAFNGGEDPGRHLGVGLAYCRLAAEKHAGRIEIRSAPGEGSFFALILPVSSRTMVHGEK